jgi:formylglycine-generating enzyme required for sulfatase activity
MGRLFVYDENMTDERAKITVAKMAAVSDIVAPEKAFIQYSDTGKLTVLPGAVIAVGENAIFETEETTLSAANLDGASSFAHGTDYYIYICDNGSDASNEVYLISQNSTFPDGDEWDDSNTRKIGGFHYGYVRNVNEYNQEINTSGTVRGSGWESNVKEDILPNSVWTTKHRPTCEPSGMVYMGNGLWGDIYLSSDDGANGLQSVYGGTPITGTEGLNWYIANEKAARVGKRLPSLAEWLLGAEGSPQGLDASNTNGHTATSNTARTAVGKIKNAVSVRNIMDMVGNVNKWLDEFLHDPTASSASWYDVVSGYGQIYMYSSTGLHALIGGGVWSSGVHAGARCVNCSNYPWNVYTNIGVWCVCDSL